MIPLKRIRLGCYHSERHLLLSGLVISFSLRTCEFDEIKFSPSFMQRNFVLFSEKAVFLLCMDDVEFMMLVAS